MATVLTVLSLVIYFGGITTLVVLAFIYLRSIDRENKAFHLKVSEYFNLLYNKDFDKDELQD